MSDTRIYKIEGMHCDGCSANIQMALDDAGFQNITINKEENLLIVPDELQAQITEIKKVVDEAGHYTLIIENV